jgi:hypothetical protein
MGTAGHEDVFVPFCYLRHRYGVAIYRDGERAERGEATLDEAAATLAVSQSTTRVSSPRALFRRANIAKARLGSFGKPTYTAS